MSNGIEKIGEKEKVSEDTVRDNREYSLLISSQLGRYADFFYDSLFIKQARHRSEFGYAKKDWLSIEEILNKIPEIISELSKNPSVRFDRDSSFSHIVGNYALMGQRSVEGRRMERVTHYGRQITEDERLRMRDLTEEDFAIFEKFKKEWDLILYYLDFLEKEENIELMKKELSSKAGYLADFEKYYLDEKKGKKADEKIPTMEVLVHLQHFNFFTRLSLDYSESEKIKSIKGLEGLVGRITQENFEEFFEKLDGKDLLDKKKIQDELLEKGEKPRYRLAA